jgi:hypothetical protein
MLHRMKKKVLESFDLNDQDVHITPTNLGLERFWDSTITGGKQELHPSDNLRTIPGVGE